MKYKDFAEKVIPNYWESLCALQWCMENKELFIYNSLRLLLTILSKCGIQFNCCFH